MTSMAMRIKALWMAGVMSGALMAGQSAWAQEPSETATQTPSPAATAAETEAYAAPATGGLGIRALAMMERVSDPQLSPDGRWVLYSVRTTDWDKSTGVSSLWLAEVSGASAPRRLAISEGGAGSGRWAVDGGAIYFTSARGGSNQVWRTDREGSAAAQVTTMPIGVSGFQVAGNGRGLYVAAQVFTDCETLECTRDRDAADKADPSTVTTYDRLPIRPWDSWATAKRSHLFLQPLNGSGLAEGAPRNLTPGLDANVSADVVEAGDALIYSSRAEGSREGLSTNSDIWRLPLSGGPAVALTASNLAADSSPTLSPDGRTLAWLASPRDGASGQPAIMLAGPDGSNPRSIAADWDRGANSLTFSSDGRTLYAPASDNGQNKLFAIDVRSGAVRALTDRGAVSDFVERGGVLVYAHETFQSPAQLFVSRRGETRQITQHNAEALANIDLPAGELFTFAGWNDEPVQGWVFRPAGYVEGQRYPVVYLIHGGPKSPWTDSWSYRWNPQTYTGAGYAVVMVNFHGSPGFGEEFTESITNNWGTRPLEDLQKGWAAALANNPFIDGDRACALGASYGGYMINWIASQWKEPWQCLVNHAGVFDVPQMMNSMDISTFVSEFGGPTWEREEIYRAQNPGSFAGQWEKPMLVLHGSRDFRVPIEQSLSTFSALQRLGIPSRFVHVPDENHWVLRPRNWATWQQEILDWTAHYTAQ
jgi:dipeptidyl aminopeptidase/acylaminoacyl peptidase